MKINESLNVLLGVLIIVGIKWPRNIFFRICCEAYDNKGFTIGEAIVAEELIHGGNSLHFYKLEGIKPPHKFLVVQCSYSTENLIQS